MGLLGDVFGAVADVARVVITPIGVVASAAKEITGAVSEEVGEAAQSIKGTIKRGF